MNWNYISDLGNRLVLSCLSSVRHAFLLGLVQVVSSSILEHCIARGVVLLSHCRQNFGQNHDSMASAFD